MATTKRPPMTKRPRPLHVPRTCERCHRRLTNAQIRDSMACVNSGQIWATVCQNCLSPTDMAQMVIRAATEEYGLNVRDERLYKREKGSEDDSAWRLAGSRD
jgi:hypothetical protein